MNPINENPDAYEVDEKNEYVCQTCRLVHWRHAPEFCDR